MHDKPRQIPAHQRTRMQNHARAPVTERHVKIIHRLRALALHFQVRMNSLWRAKKLQSLIHQVWPQVVPDSARRTRLFAPAFSHQRPVTVIMRFEMRHFAQSSFGNQRAQSEKISIPSAILKHSQHTPRFFRKSRESEASATVVVKGLSTTTFLPAISARCARSKCESFGVATTIKSISGFAKASAGVANTATSGQSCFTTSGFVETICESRNPVTLEISGV